MSGTGPSGGTDPADILARTLWGEARGEGTGGMYAVACVVLNRAARPGWWGNSIASVCQAPAQFSCWNASDPNRAKLLAVTAADPQFAAAQKIAAAATQGTLLDITEGADHYYAAAIPAPAWAKGRTPTIQIGRHLFYAIGPAG